MVSLSAGRAEPPLWHTSSDVSVLQLLHREEVGLVSWKRPLPAGIEAQLAEWALHSAIAFDEVLSLPNYDLSSATRGLAEPARTWLTTDIALLLARLSYLSESGRLRVSLEAVRTDQCRKFHVDNVRYRLVTTYLGPGTHWVPDDAVRRDALDHPPDCPCDANRAIVRDMRAVRHAVPGEVIVMKGARHPKHPGAVHRSPPIEGKNQLRIVLIASTADRR